MKSLLAILAVACCVTLTARDYKGKSIYIPKQVEAHDTSGFDEDIEFGWDSTKWDPSRMIETENIVLFWAPGFGDNITVAPPMTEIKENGDTVVHDMTVDLANLLSSLERFYHYFRDELKFTLPGSNADRYKMMVMLDYSLEGTAYGGDYDNLIGALWVAPNRLKDPRLNCIAHELGHSFQSQITCDRQGEAWGGNGFFEMTSQWMLMQVNPDWMTDENYHLEAFRNQTHKAFQHIANIYTSPYVLEYWSQNHGKDFIAQLFREGKKGEDPAATYIRMNNLSQDEFNDDMWKASASMINWDLDHIRPNARPYANQWNTATYRKGKRTFVAQENAPEAYGFNALDLGTPEAGKKVTLNFKGEKNLKGYVNSRSKEAGWRYGFVASMNDGSTIYGEIEKDPNKTISFVTPEGVDKLWLVVMGAPETHRPYLFDPWRGKPEPDPQFPWSIEILE